jgi:hypothetical protein
MLTCDDHEWAWAAPAIALFAQTIVFWYRHRGINDDEFMVYEDDATEAEQREPIKETKTNETTNVNDSGEVIDESKAE